jgi:hypothetical protein
MSAQSNRQEIKIILKNGAMKMSRGYGRGRGGTRQGIGGPPNCKCPVCGNSITHTRGTPCASLTCQKCGSRLVGST